MLSLVKVCLISLWSVPHPLPMGCSLCCWVDTEQKLSVKDRNRCRYRGRFAWQHSGRHRLRLTQDRNYGRHNLDSLLVNYAEGKLLNLFFLMRHGCITGGREWAQTNACSCLVWGISDALNPCAGAAPNREPMPFSMTPSRAPPLNPRPAFLRRRPNLVKYIRPWKCLPRISFHQSLY